MIHSNVIHQMGAYALTNGGADVLPSYTTFMADYGEKFRSFGHGALHGTIMGVFFVLPIVAINAMHEMKSWKYIWITAGYWTLCLLVMGGIICAWK